MKEMAKVLAVVLGIIISVGIGIGIIDLVTTTPEECKGNEIYTDLHFGGGGHRCMSQELYQSVVYSKCIEKLRRFNNSMSNTWGNDEYNTAPVVEFAEKFMKECKEDLTSNK